MRARAIPIRFDRTRKRGHDDRNIDRAAERGVGNVACAVGGCVIRHLTTIGLARVGARRFRLRGLRKIERKASRPARVPRPSAPRGAGPRAARLAPRRFARRADYIQSVRRKLRCSPVSARPCATFAIVPSGVRARSNPLSDGAWHGNSRRPGAGHVRDQPRPSRPLEPTD